jgi:hypothetical protein
MMMGPSPFLLAARAIHVPFTDDASPIAPSCGALQHRRAVERKLPAIQRLAGLHARGNCLPYSEIFCLNLSATAVCPMWPDSNKIAKSVFFLRELLHMSSVCALPEH